MSFSLFFDLSSLNGTNGFTISGTNQYDSAGFSVSDAGDINGDGIDDVIIGAPSADVAGTSNAGKSYVVFGSTSGFTTNLALSNLDGSNGFVLNGIDSFDSSGVVVSSAGDVNGDGVDDVVVNASGGDPNGISGAGESYVVFGDTAGFAPSIDLSNLDGSNGFVINGIESDDGSGNAISSAGDVNGDGIDDIILGAQFASSGSRFRTGESYVVFGNAAGFSASLDLSNLDGSNGFVISGIDANDFSGRSVSSAGDVNGDGIDDLIIGAYRADANGVGGAGESYVVFGSTAGFGSGLDLSNLNGNNGFAIGGVSTGDASGTSVSGAGDINGDGFDDVIIGATGADPNGSRDAGASYVVFGNGAGFVPSLALSSLNGSNGFVINGIDPSDASGRSVSGAGDVNNDGFDDVIIGAWLADPNGNFSAGESYIVFGGSAFNASFDLTSLDGSNGIKLNGIDNGDASGLSVSGAGDVNGDGFDDVIVSADNANVNGSFGVGESYIVFGMSTPTVNNDDTLRGTEADDTLDGDRGNDVLIGDRGNDLLRGSTGDDFLRGDEGNDTLRGDDGDDTLRGGTDNDVLSGGRGRDILVGSAGSDTLRGNGNNDTLRGSAGDDLLNGGTENDRLIGGSGQDTLIGGNGDDVLFAGADNDLLIGGRGRDVLGGGGGQDTFVFESLDAADLVRDFNAAADTLDISELLAGLTEAGINPLAQGYLRFSVAGSSTNVQIDRNGQSSGSQFTTVAKLLNFTDTASLQIGSNVVV